MEMKKFPLKLAIDTNSNFTIDKNGVVWNDNEVYHNDCDTVVHILTTKGHKYGYTLNELLTDSKNSPYWKIIMGEEKKESQKKEEYLFQLNEWEPNLKDCYYVNRNGEFFSDEAFGNLQKLPITTERESNVSYRQVKMKYASGKEYSFDADAVYRKVQKLTNWTKDEVQLTEWMIGKRNGSIISFYDGKVYTDESVLKKEMERIAETQPGWIFCKLKVDGSVQVKVTKEAIWK
jgi:hypothetical protein